MSIYTVHFKWKDKVIQLIAKQLDLTHPYFVSIKDLIFEQKNKFIINPSEDEVRQKFGNADHLMIPFQSVILIEENIHDHDKKVMPFSIIEEDEPEDDTE